MSHAPAGWATTGTLALLLVVPLAGAPAPSPAWTVDEEQTYEGLPLVIPSDVRVTDGGTLRLLGVHATAVGTPADPVEITVGRGGRLVLADGHLPLSDQARGTRLDGAGAPVTVEVEPGGSLLVENATLTEARLDLGADAVEIRGARLELGGGPVRVTGGSPTVAGGTWTGSPGALLEVDAGTATLASVNLTDADGSGLTVHEGAALTLQRSVVNDTGGYGITVEGGTAEVTDTRLSQADLYLVHADGGRLRLAGNELVRNHCAIELLGGADATLTGNHVTTTEHGLQIVNAGDIALDGNRFQGQFRALVLDGGQLGLQGNVFQATETAVTIEEGQALLHNNSFEGNGVALDNDGATTVDARWNWWGSPEGPNTPDGETVEGPALVDPWLTAPP